MSTEFNTAEELPVELQEDRDESWRQEMHSRLQQYRERRERNGLGQVVSPSSRVIPFRRARPGRPVEWAVSALADQPECIPPGLSQPAPASSAPAAAPAVPPALQEPPPPIVRTAAPAGVAGVAKAAVAGAAAEAIAPAAGPPSTMSAAAAASPSGPAAPRAPLRQPILPADTADTEVAEPVIRRRERRTHPAPPIAPSEQNRVRIELNTCREEPEEAQLELPQPAAPRFLRFSALVTDTLYVLAGSALFSATVLVRTGLPRQMPDSHALKRLLPAFVGVPGLLFALYVLISFTFSNGTPGMKQAGLEVRNFNGKRASRRALRRRGWAMVLSLAACGIGLVWANCDSDTLTLHDHISSTYLTVRRRARPPKARSGTPGRPAAARTTPRKPGQA